MAYREITLQGTDSTFDALRLTKKEYFGDIANNLWFFRGHADASWELKPSVWRPEFISQIKTWNSLFLAVGNLAFAGRSLPFNLTGPLTPDQITRCKEVTIRLFAERHLLWNFYSVAHDIGLSQNLLEYDMDQIWEDPRMFLSGPNAHVSALPQHHGVPTRLLDWTRDIQTAFAFALNGAQPDAAVSVWCLNAKAIKSSDYARDHQNNKARMHVFEGDNTTNRYLRAQRGAFTYFNLGEEYFIENGAYPDATLTSTERSLIKLTIQLSPEEKAYAFNVLMRERKTHAHFMPDFNSCAEYAKQILKLNSNFT